MFLLFITLFGQFKLKKCFLCLTSSSQNLLLLNVTAFAFKLLFFLTHELPHVYFFLFFSFFFFLYTHCWFTFDETSFCWCEIIIFWPQRKRWYQGKEELLQRISLTEEIKDKQKDHTTGRGKNYWKTRKEIRNHLKLYKSMIAKELLSYF